MNLIAYHGKQEIKDEYVNRVRAHRKADELVQGHGYWKGGKGCAVGCTIHGSDHAKYETALGIPRKLARLEDGLFEALPAGRAQGWPEEFLQAITPGADLGQVADQFLCWLLVDEGEGVIRFAKTDAQRAAIGKVGEMYRQRLTGHNPSVEERRAYAAAADAAAYAAAADAAAYAAAAAAAAYAAAYAADAAAAAAAAAYAAAAYAAAYAADPAYAAYAAYDDERTKARLRQAEKLLQLLRKEKP